MRITFKRPKRVRLPLSEVCSRLMVITQAEAEDYEFGRAMGAPSECDALLSRGWARARARVLREAGWTFNEVQREVKRRCSPRFAYMSGWLEDPASSLAPPLGRRRRRIRR